MRTAACACSPSTAFRPLDAELVYEGKAVGRVTSAAETPAGAIALAYVRREVPEDVELECGPDVARQSASVTR